MELFDAGRLSAAEPHLARAWATNKSNPMLSARLGMARLAMDDLVGAREALTSANSEHPEVIWTLSFILERDSRMGQALALLSGLEASGPHTGIEVGLVRVRISRLAVLESQRAAGLGDLDTAADLARRSVVYAPDSLYGHTQYVSVLLEGERWQTLADAASRAAGVFPGRPEFLRALALAQATLDRVEELAETLRFLYTLEQDPDVGVAVAQTYLAEGGHAMAEELLVALVSENPGHLEGSLLLVDIWTASFRTEQALELLWAVRRQHPSEAAPIELVGAVYARDRDWDRARAAYDTLQSAAGQIYVAGMLRLTSHMVQGSWPEAGVSARWLGDRFPDSLEARLHLGAVMDSLGMWMAAQALYSRLIGGRSDASPGLWLKLGDAAWAAGDRSEAVAAYERAVSEGARGARARLRMGTVQIESSLACSEYDQGLRLALLTVRSPAISTERAQQSGDPRHMWLQQTRVQLGRRAGKAISGLISRLEAECDPTFVAMVLSEAEKNNLDSPRFAVLMAQRELRLGLTQRAIDRLRNILVLAPGYAGAHLALGDALLDSGRPSEADAAYDRVLTLQPHHHDAFLKRLTLAEQANELEAFIDRLYLRLRSTRQNGELLQRQLVEALRRAGRSAEAAKILMDARTKLSPRLRDKAG